MNNSLSDMQPWRSRYADADQTVALAFALLVVGGVVIAATHTWFWTVPAHHSAAPAGVILLLLLAALLRRHRWAWWIFMIVIVANILGLVAAQVADKGNWTGILWSVLLLVDLAFLVSRPMRRYVGFGRRKHAT